MDNSSFGWQWLILIRFIWVTVQLALNGMGFHEQKVSDTYSGLYVPSYSGWFPPHLHLVCLTFHPATRSPVFKLWARCSWDKPPEVFSQRVSPKDSPKFSSKIYILALNPFPNSNDFSHFFFSNSGLGVSDLQKPHVVLLLHLLRGHLHDPRLPGLEEGDPRAGHSQRAHRQGGNFGRLGSRYKNRRVVGLGNEKSDFVRFFFRCRLRERWFFLSPTLGSEGSTGWRKTKTWYKTKVA